MKYCLLSKQGFFISLYLNSYSVSPSYNFLALALCPCSRRGCFVFVLFGFFNFIFFANRFVLCIVFWILLLICYVVLWLINVGFWCVRNDNNWQFGSLVRQYCWDMFAGKGNWDCSQWGSCWLPPHHHHHCPSHSSLSCWQTHRCRRQSARHFHQLHWSSEDLSQRKLNHSGSDQKRVGWHRFQVGMCVHLYIVWYLAINKSDCSIIKISVHQSHKKQQ